MMGLSIERQKAADAAFFEDWSEWECLDGLPEWPKVPNGRGGYGRRTNVDWQLYTRYYCVLDLKSRTFEIKIPSQAPIIKAVEKLPEAYQDPRAGPGWRQIAHARKQWVYWIPCEHHEAVRAALPEIKTMVTTWINRPK